MLIAYSAALAERWLSRLFTLILVVLGAAGCAENKPYRTDPMMVCSLDVMDPCNGPNHMPYYAEYRHDVSAGEKGRQRPGFDLAFIEFTERGAAFDRERMDDVLHRVKKKAESGVTTIVYIHGWKHNAASDDENVESFKRVLEAATWLGTEPGERADGEPAAREVLGIYVGWRGASVELPLIKELSYWDRKAVAEEVGKGGVTELLLRIEELLRDEDDPNKNQYLVIGHSLGAAVLLTGLNEVFLERIINEGPDRLALSEGESLDPCILTKPFGHGVALLNPAIEASEILQLKHLVGNTCFEENQERFMHIISSEADKATTGVFEAAQWIGLGISWEQAIFKRQIGKLGQTKREITFDEMDLDVTTVGNYEPFLTGYLFANGPEADLGDPALDSCISEPRGANWQYVSFKREDCFASYIGNQDHVPVGDHEPLSFIKTDENFIDGHNDIFNQNVAAYLATILAESRQKRARRQLAKVAPEEQRSLEIWHTLFEGPNACHPQITNSKIIKSCRDSQDKACKFEFGPCFEAYHEEFGKILTNIKK